MKIPVLVMVAGHDAEVPPDDVKYYPGLFHLYMPSTATGKGDVPEDWGRPSHVSPEVVYDIASWISDNRH